MIHDTRSILYKSSHEIADIIRKGELSCYQIISSFIENIKKYNILTNALAYDCFSEALKIAIFYDKKFKKYNKLNKIDKLPKYFGVPVIIKECLELKNKPLTYGYTFRKDEKGKKNNKYCQKLIDNGFIILGAGNTSEGCMWIESDNKIYGKTNNPYDLKRTSGGSSGGTAVLITTLASPFGLCNDASGSIRIPAFYNCLFGHKPTSGCIKGFYSDINRGNSLDEISQGGIVSRDSKELWPIIKLLSDNKNIQKKKYENLKLEDITFFYIGNSFKSIVTNELDITLNKIIRDTLLKISQKGGIVNNDIIIRELELAPLLILNYLSACDTRDSSDVYLQNNSNYNNFIELGFINFGLVFLKKLSDKYKSDNTDTHFNLFSKILEILETKIMNIFNSSKNVVLISPTFPALAPYHDTSLKYFFDIAMVSIFNVLKLPVTQVPLGLNYEGIPLGFQIIGNKFDDRLTIKVAELLEKEDIAKWVHPKIIK